MVNVHRRGSIVQIPRRLSYHVPTVPILECRAGYYCKDGSKIAKQHICPKGYFCLIGTSDPIPCPSGTFSDKTGLKYVTECEPCPPGKYCNGTGLDMPTGNCDPGFFCPSGFNATIPNPPESVCPVGFHCPGASSSPEPCEPGYFTNFTHSSECIMCPAGFYCLPVNDAINQSVGYFLCPPGYFCPNGTGASHSKCPAGTWSDKGGLRSAAECNKCPAGKFCEGSKFPTGECKEGFFCENGVDVSNPNSINNTGIGGICPPGTFCVNGSSKPIPCPKGKDHYNVSFYFSSVTNFLFRKHRKHIILVLS